MHLKELVADRRREFDISVCLTGVIPLLVFLYLLVVKIASFQIFIGEVGYIMFTTVLIFLLGIMTGRKMLWSIIQDLVERNRLAAISETTLALSHEINNPLLTVRGNLELLENDFSRNKIVDETIKNRLEVIKDHCERIRQVTDKLATLSRPVSTPVSGDIRMVDLTKSN